MLPTVKWATIWASALYGHMALYTIDKNGGEAALVKQSLSAPDIK
ncbi:MAG: hypothetical protein ACLUE2_21215 [Bacteroides cellulosilyticus]